MNVDAMSSGKYSTEDELRGLLEDSHGAYAALVSEVLQKISQIDALTKRAETAEARRWQYAGVPCDNCGNDSARVSCDPINEDSGIERRVYHCPECNRAWVKVHVVKGG